MKNLLQEYKAQRPEIIFEWADPETGAEGWIVINSLRNGAAGGGRGSGPWQKRACHVVFLRIGSIDLGDA